MTHNKMPSSDMDMDLILTLDALLRDQNITHAAARLGISQPAMSDVCPPCAPARPVR
nr:LysR family transcriptional regulator [Enterobacter hormaechei]